MKTWTHPNRGYFDSVKGILYESGKPFDLPDEMEPPRGSVAYDPGKPQPEHAESRPTMSEVGGAKKRMAADR